MFLASDRVRQGDSNMRQRLRLQTILATASLELLALVAVCQVVSVGAVVVVVVVV